jgi:hypothetical protein
MQTSFWATDLLRQEFILLRKPNEVKTLEENAFQAPQKCGYVIIAPLFAFIKNLDLVCGSF